MSYAALALYLAFQEAASDPQLKAPARSKTKSPLFNVVETVDDRNPASPCMYICTTIPECLWFWYIRSAKGHEGLLGSIGGSK